MELSGLCVDVSPIGCIDAALGHNARRAAAVPRRLRPPCVHGHQTARRPNARHVGGAAPVVVCG